MFETFSMDKARKHREKAVSYPLAWKATVGISIVEKYCHHFCSCAPSFLILDSANPKIKATAKAKSQKSSTAH